MSLYLFSFQMYCYEDILLKIGQLSAKIDYLKMDIEGSELGFFKNVFEDSLYLLSNIVQFGLEMTVTFDGLVKISLFLLNPY